MTMTAGEWAGAAMTAATITVSAGVGVNTTRRSVKRNGVEIFLPPQQFEILLLVSKAKFGVTPAQLFEAIYADDPNGGPLCGRKTIHVQRRNLNCRIAPLGLQLNPRARATEKEFTNSKFSGGQYDDRRARPNLRNPRGPFSRDRERSHAHAAGCARAHR